MVITKEENMGLLQSIESSIKLDERRLAHYEKLANTTVEGRLNCKWDKRRNRTYYYLKESNKSSEHPVEEKTNSIVWKLQMKRFAQEMIIVLKNNIEAKKRLLNELLPDSGVDILEKIPKAYRPNSNFKPKDKNKTSKRVVPQSESTYKREQLIVETSFGLFVRSKGELAIAELLYSLGIEFYYEKRLELRVLEDGFWVKRSYYPDFTIILSDGRTVYWEHRGLMDDEDYVERNIRKDMDYNLNGIFQSHNYIVTEEGPNNHIDFAGIKKIVECFLL